MFLQEGPCSNVLRNVVWTGKRDLEAVVRVVVLRSFLVGLMAGKEQVAERAVHIILDHVFNEIVDETVGVDVLANLQRSCQECGRCGHSWNPNAFYSKTKSSLSAGERELDTDCGLDQSSLGRFEIKDV